MDVLIEKKMIDIKTEPVEMVMMDENSHHHHCKISRRGSSSSISSQQAELEPCEEFPILYGLLTAPKSFKPRNSEELGLIPPVGSSQEMESKMDVGSGGLVIHSRVQLVDCRARRRSRHNSSDSEDEIDSQNLDYCSRDSSRSLSSNRSPQVVDSSSNLSAPDRECGSDENNSPVFMSHLNGQSNHHHHQANRHNPVSEDISADEDESFHLVVNSPGSSGSSMIGDDSNLDDNIPTSTTSGFRRKASRLETAIGNIVKRRGKVQKRSSNVNSNCGNSNNNTVPISMAPSSPTVSTTCVDPPPPRGRSEILERILRSTTCANTVNVEVSHHRSRSALSSPVRRCVNDNNNNESGGQDEPYAKLRDLLTMSEDQLVKRRRLEYGLSDKMQNQHQRHHSPEPHNNRRRDFSPPRNNILASLLQKGRAPYDPSTYHLHPSGVNGGGVGRHHSPALVSINKLSDNPNNHNSLNDERPYKCSLCDLRFKKLPLLNRHIKTHSHIKRYVCRFCSHAFKRSDNLLAHMRTSCKGIKDTDTCSNGNRSINKSNKSIVGGGQIISQLLSSPPTGVQVSSMVSRSHLEEALLNLRHQHQEQNIRPEKRYVPSPSPSLVSTTTGSPPLPTSAYRGIRRPVPTNPMDFQSRHSKLLEILSGSPVISNDRFQNIDGRRIVDADAGVGEEDVEDMTLPLSLKVERRSSSPSTTPTSSSSSNHSQFLRSHNHRILYSNRNELPSGGGDGEDEDYHDYDDADEENDDIEPLNLGRRSVPPPTPPPVIQSARSRDHPEIVSILSRQPKNVVMMGPDLRKLVGIDA